MIKVFLFRSANNADSVKNNRIKTDVHQIEYCNNFRVTIWIHILYLKKISEIGLEIETHFQSVYEFCSKILRIRLILGVRWTSIPDYLLDQNKVKNPRFEILHIKSAQVEIGYAKWP